MKTTNSAGRGPYTRDDIHVDLPALYDLLNLAYSQLVECTPSQELQRVSSLFMIARDTAERLAERCQEI